MPDGVRYLQSQLMKTSRQMLFVGGGFYHPTALAGARLLRPATAASVEAVDALQFRDDPPEIHAAGSSLIVASGSRSRTKRDVHSTVNRFAKLGAKIFSVTDSNDRELVDRSNLALMLPLLHEMTSSLLAQTLFEWLARENAGDKHALPASGLR
jgi:DNA-binding MurR/RpiR family transcriptional regulator